MILDDEARSLWNPGDASTWEAEIPGARIQGAGEYTGRGLKGCGFPEEYSTPPFQTAIQIGTEWNDCHKLSTIDWMQPHIIHRIMGGQYDHEQSI